MNNMNNKTKDLIAKIKSFSELTLKPLGYELIINETRIDKFEINLIDLSINKLIVESSLKLSVANLNGVRSLLPKIYNSLKIFNEIKPLIDTGSINFYSSIHIRPSFEYFRFKFDSNVYFENDKYLKLAFSCTTSAINNKLENASITLMNNVQSKSISRNINNFTTENFNFEFRLIRQSYFNGTAKNKRLLTKYNSDFIENFQL